MVLHQRTKQAFQSKDLSVPYAPCWSLLLEPFALALSVDQKQQQQQQQQPLVQAWIDFVQSSKHEQEAFGRTTSQQQAAAFKKLEQAVKAQKEKNPQLLEQHDFQKAFSQFISLYYFSSAKLASRKQIFALIQTLQPYFQPDESDPNGTIVTALRSVIMNSIFALEPILTTAAATATATQSQSQSQSQPLGVKPQIQIEMAWHQRTLCLYTTLDYTMGRTALHADMDIILDQLSQLLQARVITTNVQVGRDHIPAEYTEAMLDLEFILKLILAIISRLIVTSNGSLPSSPSAASSTSTLSTSPTSNSNRFEISSTHNPPQYILRILKDAITVSSSPVYHRDLSSISGMIFANLIDLTSPTIQEVTRRTVQLVFGETSGMDTVDLTSLPQIPRNMVEMDFGWNTYLGEKCGPGEEDAGMYMLGIVRGLLTNIRQEALVMPIQPVSTWYAPPVFHDLQKRGQQDRPKAAEQESGLVLHQVLFHAIAYLCATSRDISSKTFAFETMGHWLQQTKLHLSEKSLASAQMKEALANCIDEQAQEKLSTYVLDYWEDPVDTVQHKVKNILELLLDIVYLKSRLRSESTTPDFVIQLLGRILMADGHRKSKYPILAILVGRVSMAEVIALRQDALAQAILALDQLATAPGAAVAINAMIGKSWKECLELDSLHANVLIPVTTTKKNAKNNTSEYVEKSTQDSEALQQVRKTAIQPWIDFWLKPIAQALTTENDLIRKHLGHFIFSPLFSTCPEAFWTLLEVLNDQSGTYSSYISDAQYRFNAIVLAIKIGRSLDLVDSSNYVDDSNNVSSSSSADLTKSSKIPISILHDAMYHASGDIRLDVLGILCESRRSTTPVSSIEYRLLKQFLPLNLNSVIPDFRQKLYTHLAKFLTRVRGNCFVLAREIARLYTPVGKKNLTQEQVDRMINEREAKVAETKEFLEWLLDLLFSTVYPGASFQRVSTSLRILGVMIKTFGIESTPLPSGSKPDEVSNFPFQLPIATEERTKILLGCLLNPFDHCREQALDILMTFKAPYAGYESKESVDSLVRWGLDWLKSTRAGESDSGGLVMKTIFVKYAIELGWDIKLPYGDVGEVSNVNFAKETGNPAVDFTIRLQNLLRIQLEKARLNQLNAAHHHPLHGSLIGLRYLFSSIDYASPLVTNHRPLWQTVHADMMDLVESVCGTVMGVLSNPSPEGNIPATFTEMEESIDAVISASGGDEMEQSGGPNHQVILSYCWRAIKESSSLMELVLSKATIISSALKTDGVLQPVVLDRAGGLFRRLLTTIRHPGAFSSVFPAYISLCTRLLNSEDATLAALPRAWLEENLDAILSDSISVTRRSAGLPLCILALVNAELSDSRRTLLPMVMRRVMAIALKPVSPDANQQVDLPQIHAMNVLRRLFMDAKLSTSVLPYVGQGLELSIRAFSSPSWAVRNCGVMLFSTLLHRVFGAKRVRDEHLAINGITSRELFARLEDLRGFLQGQLEVAVSQLLNAESPSSSSSSTDRVHPGLYPVLTLLSRLQPSLHPDPADAVDGGMSVFVTLVRRCAASAIWKTREMAARALIPLIASRDLMDLVLDILQGCLRPTISQNETHGLLVQVQFLLRGHLLGEGVADRVVRRSFVTRFAEMFGPVSEHVLKTGCSINQWMILSICTEFIFGQDWIGQDNTVETEAGEGKGEKDMQMEVESESQYEEMTRLSHSHFTSIREFIFNYAIIGLVEGQQSYRTQIGGHLVRRLLARVFISATVVLGDNTMMSKEQATETVVMLLRDEDYEIRLETLETLLHYHQQQQQQHQQSNGNTNRVGGSIDMETHLDTHAIHDTLIHILFEGEDNLECLRLEVAFISILGTDRPFPKGSQVEIVEFWNRLLMRIDDRATGGVAVVEAILPAIGKVFAQIWSDISVEESLRIDCLNRWADSIHKFANEEQTLQLREAALESIAFFTNDLLDPKQAPPSVDVTRAYLKLFEALIWQLQDDEQEVRDEATLIVSRASRLPYAVSSEKALTLVYDHQLCLFAGLGVNEIQLQLLVDSLISSLMGTNKPARVVIESLQPSKTLFNKESPNLYREPLISIQLTLRSLKSILSSRPSFSDLPVSIQKRFEAFQKHCLQDTKEVQQAIEKWSASKLDERNNNNDGDGDGNNSNDNSGGANDDSDDGVDDGSGEKHVDRSPWGVSGRKPIFEVLYKLAGGASLLNPAVVHSDKSNLSNTDRDTFLEIIHDPSKIHPVIVHTSQRQHDTCNYNRQLFLIE
ncbi:hypothetical protein BX616_011056 [Lobosporangium transversale]|uniref:Putative death-receptor fusion protein-domain-containing protein n=1 Tax=Lobosporangium transversale TaxID=64571 RepID=A0A1Y2GNX3_9FUNG|nr:putative death-receptor fusion protein-domain-containing protein [Lobosporangium transversale]KAF9917861.1 hypothetical protein BX616_011056 [Lobosporangium transversale]ORZ15564.1 putative death-receptor fusion protein-domain-containing protein [Lobosporangium transversale]|eukprot:XP_021881312.1 putative death-receptor fusion protein-domain-containing protein [Lobosporangium transversale]